MNNQQSSVGLLVALLALIVAGVTLGVTIKTCDQSSQTGKAIEVIRTNTLTTSENTTALRNPTVDIPDSSLVRAGTHHNVYLIKRHPQFGLFRRLVVSDNLFPSYGWTMEMVDSVSAADLQSIEESRLVRLPNGDVYQISYTEEDKGSLTRHGKQWSQLSERERASIFEINWQEYSYHHHR